MSPASPEVTLASSNVAYVEWSDAYEVTSVAKTVFPCYGSFLVQFQYPECNTNGHDKLRLFMQVSERKSSIIL